MPEKSITYDTDTWELGTIGTSSVRYYGRPYILNMRMYPDGSLGPRPRWKRWGQQVIAGDPDLGGAADNTIVAAEHRNTFTSAVTEGFLVKEFTGISFVYVTPTATATITGPALADNYGPNSWVDRIGAFEWVINGQYIRLEGTGTMTATDGIAALDTAFSGSNTYKFVGSCVHNGRAFMWGPMLNGSNNAFNENRIYYSDAYAYTAFTSASQFFDVDGPVAGCASIGSSLLIWTASGDWFILQGRGDPADGVLDSLGKGRIPGADRQPAVFDRRLVFYSYDYTTTVFVDEAGRVDDETFRHISFSSTPISYYQAAAASTQANSVNNTILLSTFANIAGCHHLHRGVWTRESWASDLVGGNQILRSSETQGTEQLILREGTGPFTWAPYTRRVDLAQPEAEDLTEPFSEAPEGAITVPRIFEPDKNVRVVNVVVDGRYWKGGDWRTPDINVQVFDGQTTHAMSSVGSPTDTISSVPDATGGRYRFTFKPDGELPMEAFQDVQLINLVGVTVERVTVTYEDSDQGLL